MKEIASNPFYHMAVDQSRNRIYIRFMGNWVNKKDMPNWERDIQATTEGLARGYTLMVDFSEIGTILVPQLFEFGMNHFKNTGVSKTAEIHKDRVLPSVQTDQAAKVTNYQKRDFNDRNEADAWLDE